MPVDGTPPADAMHERVRKWLVTLMVFFSFLLAMYLAIKKGEPLPPVPVIPQQPAPVVIAPDDEPPPNAFSWVKDPEEVRRVVATMPRPVFKDTPAGQSEAALPAHTYLWEAYGKLFEGKTPPPQDQRDVGSCVSFGSGRAVERTLAVQVSSGEPFEFKHVVEEMIYGGSRVEIGNGRIRGDGSVGAWAAKFLTMYGVVPRGVYDKYDLTKYDTRRCRDWGRYGVPDDLEPEAKKYPAGDCTLIQSAAEAQRALSQGYGIFVCSGQGFSRQRDQNGVARASGSWAHCMCIDGYHQEGNTLYFHIENSWGSNYHVGPVGWGNPSTAGFWAVASVVDRMLREGDSFAVSAVKGFPARRPNSWLVQVPWRHGHFAHNSLRKNDVASVRGIGVPARGEFALAW
jgi:hypothetical protein